MEQETRDIAKREEELYTEANKLQKQTSKNEDGSLMIRKETESLKKWINKVSGTKAVFRNSGKVQPEERDAEEAVRGRDLTHRVSRSNHP